jgi:septum formation protein
MSLWIAEQPLVLASKSGARRAVLEAAGIPLDIRPADVDERAIEARAGETDPGRVAGLLAEEKARAAARVAPGRLVLGADQTLALGTRRFSKPADAAEARAQLRALSGQTHALHSGIALVRDGELLFSHVGVARLTMRALSDAFVARYLAAAGPHVSQSVGGYQLEGLGIHLFEQVDGDHFTILGLPLIPLLRYLRQSGAVIE